MHRDFEREAWRDLEPLGVVGGEQEFPVTKQVCPCRGCCSHLSRCLLIIRGRSRCGQEADMLYLSLSLAPLNDIHWIRGDYCLQTFQKGKQQNIKHVQVASMYSLLPVYKTYQ